MIYYILVYVIGFICGLIFQAKVLDKPEIIYQIKQKVRGRNNTPIIKQDIKKRSDKKRKFWDRFKKNKKKF